MEFASLESYDIEGTLIVSLYDIIETHSADTNHILSSNRSMTRRASRRTIVRSALVDYSAFELMRFEMFASTVSSVVSFDTQ